MPRDTLVVDLRGLGPLLTAYCKQRGLGRSDLVRRVIATAIDNARAETAPLQASPQANTNEMRRISLRVSGQVHQQLTTAATRCGVSLTRYIEAAAIGAPLPVNLMQIAPDVVAALVRSTYELRAVGRNINQIAHGLHLQPGVITTGDRERLHALTDHVKTHVECAARVLRDVTIERRVANRGQ